MSDAQGQYMRLLSSAVENLAQAFHDQYVEKNAKLRSEAGLKTVIVRDSGGKCCDWCADLDGIYTYDDAPKDVFARHANCNCTVSCKTSKGTWQDAWSKKEYDSFRESRIAREEEILYKDEISPYQRVAKTAAQEGEIITIPPFMEGSFDDCHQLTISDEDRKTFQNIHDKVSKTGCEYGEIITSKGKIPCESADSGKVVMDTSSIDEYGLKLYHGHTNDTIPSQKDLSRFVYDEKVDTIGVITQNRDIFVVTVGDGYIPTESEYWKIANNARHYAETSVISKYNIGNLSEKQIEYLIIREKNIEIIRQFGWRIEGGKL